MYMLIYYGEPRKTGGYVRTLTFGVVMYALVAIWLAAANTANNPLEKLNLDG